MAESWLFSLVWPIGGESSLYWGGFGGGWALGPGWVLGWGLGFFGSLVLGWGWALGPGWDSLGEWVLGVCLDSGLTRIFLWFM